MEENKINAEELEEEKEEMAENDAAEENSEDIDNEADEPSLDEDDAASEYNDTASQFEELEEKLNAHILLKIQQAVEEQYVDESIYDYIVDIANRTRKSENFSMGISPRGSIAMLKVAKAKAFLSRRSYVIPQDIIDIHGIVCAHRIELSPQAAANGLTPKTALKAIIDAAPMPKVTSPKK